MNSIGSQFYLGTVACQKQPKTLNPRTNPRLNIVHWGSHVLRNSPRHTPLHHVALDKTHGQDIFHMKSGANPYFKCSFMFLSLYRDSALNPDS